jgi:hypothetical protein
MAVVAAGEVRHLATGTNGGGAEWAPDIVGGVVRLAFGPEQGGGARLASSSEVGTAAQLNRSRSRTDWIHRMKDIIKYCSTLPNALIK